MIRMEVNKEMIVIRDNIKQLIKQFEQGYGKYDGIVAKLNKIEGENKEMKGRQDQYKQITQSFIDE